MLFPVFSPFARTSLKIAVGRVVVAFSFAVGCLLSSGQKPDSKGPKLGPAKLANQPIILDESVVSSQWPQTLPRVNIPWMVTQLSPGQCFRVGAVASGDDSADLFKETQIGFTVHYAGHDTVVPMAAAVGFKRIKPEGTDFVQAALNAGNVKYEVPTSGTIAASVDKWCVPADATAGEVKIDGVVMNGGKRTALKSMSLRVSSPENPGKPPFTNKTIDEWVQTYYRHPQPAFLIDLMPLISENNDSANSLQQFVISAMKRDPAVVARLGTQLAKAAPMQQAMMVKLAAEAGVEMKIPFELSPMQKEIVAKLPDVPDAFHPVADIHIGEAQDMLWSMFSATGDRAPVDSIIGMLGWRADYEAFAKMRASQQEIKEVTPSIAHAVAYSAAGWSIGSFQRTDPLVADYIAATLADPKTPEAIKKELQSLDSNPAFKRQ
jgi:hypothetical protein